MFGKRLNSDNDKDKEKIDQICLTVNNEKKYYNTIEYNIQKAEQYYMDFDADENENENDKFETIKKVISYCEIDGDYNFNYLKLCRYNDFKNYNSELEYLGPFLSNEQYKKLTNKTKIHPGEYLYELFLKLINNREEEFDNEAKKLNAYNYNCPLIYSNERARLQYYISLFKNPSDEKNKAKQNKYGKIKERIKSEEEIIKNMQKYFFSLNLDDKSINMNLYLLILFLTENFMIEDSNIIIMENLFKKEFLGQEDTKFDVIDFGKGYKIEKKDNKYIISNKFQIKKEINEDDYVINNLIKDYQTNLEKPLELILLRNHSLKYFNENKKNINLINDKDLYNDFIEYFYSFISSKLVKEALIKSNNQYIIELIESKKFPGFKLDERYVKIAPFFQFFAEGFTNKDFVCSFISYFPFLVENHGPIKNLEQYYNLANINFYFNLTGKFILLLHEILIHLAYGYLEIMTGREILNSSPKSSKKSKIDEKENNEDTNKKNTVIDPNLKEINKIESNSKDINENDVNGPKFDGGSFFEKVLFGEKVSVLKFQNVLTILDEECFNFTVQQFQEKFNSKFNKKEFKGKEFKGFMGKLMEKYKFNIDILNINDIQVNMRTANGQYLIMKLNNIIPDSISIHGITRKRKKYE